MTEWTLTRTLYVPACTLGLVEVGDVRVWTLERPWLDNEPGSCVPCGRYRLVLEPSPAFHRDLWELKDVLGRAECKFHPANLAKELKGCIAPGLSLIIHATEYAATTESRTALERLHAVMGSARETWLTIRNAAVPAEVVRFGPVRTSGPQ